MNRLVHCTLRFVTDRIAHRSAIPFLLTRRTAGVYWQRKDRRDIPPGALKDCANGSYD